MFCEHCGKQIPDQSAFCEHCGQKQEVVATPAPAPAPAPAPINPNNSKKDVKQFVAKNKLWLIIAACVVVVGIVVGCVVSAISKRVDLKDYMTVEATGYDGYGTVTYNFDFEAFAARLQGKDAPKATDVADLDNMEDFFNLIGSAVDSATDYAEIASALSIEVVLPDGKENGKIGNGDVVTYKMSFNEVAAKKFKVTVKEVTYEYEVAGLEEAEVYDVLSHFQVNYSGVDGRAYAYITSIADETVIGDLTFSISENNNYINISGEDGYYHSIYVYTSGENSNLSEGDTVTVTTSVEETALAERGVVLVNLTADYTVENLGKYAASLDDLSSANAALSEKAQQIVTDFIYSEWSYAVHGRWYGDYDDQKVGEDMKLYKTIITTPKASNGYNQNVVWYIFSITLNDDDLEKDTVFYFPVRFPNIVIAADGTVSYIDDLDYNRYHGYTDYKEFYDECVKDFSMNIEVSE